MKRRSILALATSAALAAGVPGAAAADTEIEWLQWFAAEVTDGTFEGIAEEFEAANPDIKVTLVTQPFGKVRESVVTDNAIGVGADVIGMNMPWTMEFLDIGILEPLDEYLARDDNSFDTGELVQGPIGKIEGKTWMVPLNSFPFVLHVNMELVKKAGFDAPPTSWDELLEQATAISKLGDGISGIGLPFSTQPPSNGPILVFLPILYSAGGRIMDGTTPNYDNPKVVEALMLLKQLNDAGAVAPGAASRTGGVDLEEFIAGRTGFLIAPGLHSNSVTSRNPDLDYQLARMPQNGSNGFRDHGWEVAMSASSDNKDAAWKFIDFLLSPEVNARIAKATNTLPGNKAALDAIGEGAAEPLLTQIDIVRNDESVEEMRQSPKASASWSVMTEEIQAMLRGDQTPEETAANTQSRWMDLLD
ncbi:ABC transporter substrate-binding protein [Halovulum sp. GXIMD14794]